MLARFVNMKKHFGATKAVDGITVEVEAGEIRAIVGENGSGKSTLLSMIAGILRPDSGEMELNGSAYHPKSQADANRKGVSMIVQEISTLKGLTVAENIFLGREAEYTTYGFRDLKKLNQMADKKLKEAGLTEIKPDEDVSHYSLEQRKMIELVRAADINPRILMVDETTTALSQTGREELYRLMRKTKEKGNSVLFISHDLQVVRRISQRMGVMYLGSMVEQGLTAEIYEEPWHPYTKELLRAMLPLDPKKAARQKRLILKETRNHSQDTENGCPYAPRCRYAMECCHKEKPGNYRFGEREVRCFLYSEAHTKKRAKDYHMTSQI